MRPDNLRPLIQLAEQRDQKHYDFLRQLLVLASGSLAALVAFRTGANSTGPALWCLRLAWAALGAGILLGSAALHGEVWTAADLANRAAAELKERWSSGADQPFSIFSKRPVRYKWFARGCYASLLVAVVAVVAHAILQS